MLSSREMDSGFTKSLFSHEKPLYSIQDNQEFYNKKIYIWRAIMPSVRGRLGLRVPRRSYNIGKLFCSNLPYQHPLYFLSHNFSCQMNHPPPHHICRSLTTPWISTPTPAWAPGPPTTSLKPSSARTGVVSASVEPQHRRRVKTVNENRLFLPMLSS